MIHKFIILLPFLLITSLFLSSTVLAIADPASTYCIEQGYKLEVRTDPSSGGQYGVCIFPDGKECKGWEFFRGECGVEYQKEPSIIMKDYTVYYIVGIAGLIILIFIIYFLLKRRKK